MGVITGFGSIYVNGVEYETDGASVDIDGVSSIETDLGVGDVVTLRGTVNADGVTGTATAVSATDELEGYVLANNLAADGTGTLIVMGQTVTVSADTIFDSDNPASITGLVAGDIVEVSGFSSGDGQIFATRIETKNAAEDIELKGVIANLDASSFSIGSLIVDYSSASEVPAAMADGLYVEVKAETMPTDNGDGTYALTATKVELEGDGDMDIDGDEGDEIEYQAVVTSIDGLINTPPTIEVNGIEVIIGELEIEEDNLATADLAVGMTITVEGEKNADGILVVKEIEAEEMATDEAEGLVESVDATLGTVTIAAASGSMNFTVTNSTRIYDERDEGVVPVHYFSLADVAQGDFLEIDYYVDSSSGENVATKLERDDVPDLVVTP